MSILAGRFPRSFDAERCYPLRLPRNDPFWKGRCVGTSSESIVYGIASITFQQMVAKRLPSCCQVVAKTNMDEVEI